MTVRILQGDVMDRLAGLPDESVHCCITSPPYWGLRDYGTGQWSGGDPECDHSQKLGGNGAASAKQVTSGGTQSYQYRQVCGKCGAQRTDAQLGLESTLAEHLDKMVDVFREVRRVLRKDGVCFVNYGDCYASSVNGRPAEDVKALGKDDRTFRDKPFSTVQGTLKPKDLCMVSNRLAIALQDDGWWVRSEIIWHKPNPMPESATDRPTSAHEKVWLLTKSARYFWDAEAVRETASPDTHARYARGRSNSHKWADGGPGNQTIAKSFEHMRKPGVHPKAAAPGSGIKANESFSEAVKDVVGERNLRNVWTIATHPYSDAHFATFPPALVERCLRAGTSERGVCSCCGAPWRRVVERQGLPASERANGDVYTGAAYKQPQSAPRGPASNFGEVTTRTTGWTASCTCAAPVVPATCLDIFGGSGTVGLVADRMKRDAILIELNPEYAEMARRRIEGDAPLFQTIQRAREILNGPDQEMAEKLQSDLMDLL